MACLYFLELQNNVLSEKVIANRVKTRNMTLLCFLLSIPRKFPNFLEFAKHMLWGSLNRDIN